jgi:hypothetical protein
MFLFFLYIFLLCIYLGAFIGAPTSNMAVLKPIFECVPDDKAKQFFQFTIRNATEFSVGYYYLI